MRRDPGKHDGLGIRVAIWGFALALVAAVQGYSAYAARADADMAVAAVTRDKERTGSYPATLGEVGLDPDDLWRKWRAVYAARGGRPSLFYATTFTPFESYHYDFQARR